MFPLDLEEFSSAIGINENVIEALRKNFEASSAVEKYLDTNNLQERWNFQTNRLESSSVFYGSMIKASLSISLPCQRLDAQYVAAKLQASLIL